MVAAMRWTAQKADQISLGILVACKTRPRSRNQLHDWMHDWLGTPNIVAKTTINNRLYKLEEFGYLSRGPDPHSRESVGLHEHGLPYILHFQTTPRGYAQVQEWMLWSARLMEVLKLGEGVTPHNKRAREMVRQLGLAPRVDPRAERAPFVETKYNDLH